MAKTASSERSAPPKVAARNGAAALPRIGRLDGTGPMWRQIRRVLAQPILRGDWPPGTRMPAELELTERFGASRMTVSKAVQSLASEGLVQRRRKLGTVVADRPQERPVFEIWDIADLVTRAGGAYSYKLLACEQLKRDPDKRELLGVSPRTPTLSMLCLHLCNGEPYQLEERLVNIDAAPGITCRPLDEAGPGPWLVTHVPWTDAEHKISAQEAPPAIAAHLKVRTQAACLVVDRRTWNEAVPVTYARLWHAGNQHSLVGHFQPTR